MGDGETYDQLTLEVNATRHRFFPGNHDHYHHLPVHSLGDFGATSLGEVDFFFIRGAASTDRDKLIRLGEKLGKQLWFAEEELTDEQMAAAEAAYLAARPEIVLSHDAPSQIARETWRLSLRHAAPRAVFRASRTNAFLARLLDQHGPRLWMFGHHHVDWRDRQENTEFVCVGELSHVDIDAQGVRK